ncbi:ring-hydroxylating oxygenase subunit alpha [Methyloligella sp. 2.7D]|uniref:ring-hydroxylating oxygenase subunit alpha n=1 Tax=unclassified Methyloligella TaxID=2625955 RepID=UPI00157C4025|nr:ring-hydroxylating oxygenase subunit alpha [Methyloligella sp. GL2]QKP76635.1 ring-hydroxylating oxygenase subunit alpha [Methyloligella sp. GL2]
MLHRPDFGFQAEGHDLCSASFYAEALDGLGEASVLPPVVFRSLRFSLLEDETIWTRDWVAIGCGHEIPGEGDLLPFTVGNHGIHVQRAGSGLTGRFNKAQHGGCRAIPLQCQTGKKTKCSFTSCGYSRDRSAISAGELGDATPAMEQYLGVQPERLLPVHAASLGPLIFVNLDVAPATDEPAFSGLERAGGFFQTSMQCIASGWLEFAANWKLLGQHLCDGKPVSEDEEQDWLLAESFIAGKPAEVAWLFPNLVLMQAAGETCAIVLQHTALGQTLCRYFVFGDVRDGSSAFWTGEIERRAAKACADHQETVRWGTNFRSETIGAPLPRQSDPLGLWMQRMVARRVMQTPSAPFSQPLYQHARG